MIGEFRIVIRSEGKSLSIEIPGPGFPNKGDKITISEGKSLYIEIPGPDISIFTEIIDDHPFLEVAGRTCFVDPETKKLFWEAYADVPPDVLLEIRQAFVRSGLTEGADWIDISTRSP